MAGRDWVEARGILATHVQEAVMSGGPLSGVRVLEITHQHAGPWGGCLLADMGADVTKVESPDGGDRTRRGGAQRDGKYGYKFMGINRNKKSLAVDLSADAGLEVMYKLIERSDVFYNNLRPDTVNKLKLSYEDLSRINPRIIHCNLTGYGTDGPWKDLYGQDLQIQALCGLASLTGFGDPVSIPTGTPVVDAMTGTLAALGVLAALYHREQTGKGQQVHTSLLAGGLAMQANFLAEYMGGRRMPDRARAGNIVSAPHIPCGVARMGKTWPFRDLGATRAGRRCATCWAGPRRKKMCVSIHTSTASRTDKRRGR